VELQKRSGDSMAWHDAFHAIVEGLPAEMRPEGFAAAKAAGVGRARAFAPPPVPRDLLASTGLTEGDDLVMKPGDAGALLAMTASSVLSVRREAASTLAMLSKSSASAAAFAVDGTAHALAQLAATGPDARTCDALVASAALAVVANSMAAALCQGAAAAACMAVRAEAKSVAPALLAAVDAARPELADLPSSDADLARRAVLRESGRALVAMSGDAACASEIERARGLASLARVAACGDSRLAAMANKALGNVIACTC